MDIQRSEEGLGLIVDWFVCMFLFVCWLALTSNAIDDSLAHPHNIW